MCSDTARYATLALSQHPARENACIETKRLMTSLINKMIGMFKKEISNKIRFTFLIPDGESGNMKITELKIYILDLFFVDVFS